jgi:hypothetical protein
MHENSFGKDIIRSTPRYIYRYNTRKAIKRKFVNVNKSYKNIFFFCVSYFFIFFEVFMPKKAKAKLTHTHRQTQDESEM